MNGNNRSQVNRISTRISKRISVYENLKPMSQFDLRFKGYRSMKHVTEANEKMFLKAGLILTMELNKEIKIASSFFIQTLFKCSIQEELVENIQSINIKLRIYHLPLLIYQRLLLSLKSQKKEHVACKSIKFSRKNGKLVILTSMLVIATCIHVNGSPRIRYPTLATISSNGQHAVFLRAFVSVRVLSLWIVFRTRQEVLGVPSARQRSADQSPETVSHDEQTE
ncbi:hypothetical protein E2986_12929 [Frieseomelitta varia]|uniref:Uncharacterized protein n=1 Tax=Frieseomelitta varia TaxID=561572 RepID=A0A833RUW9_9HYME|nr:hypothetical protein E2986_12929 [Frieseomelitta varia]